VLNYEEALEIVNHSARASDSKSSRKARQRARSLVCAEIADRA
jgi:hypothetical protein